MPDDKEDLADEGSISVRIARRIYEELEDYREELRQKRKPRPTRGALLESAWRTFRQGSGESPSAPSGEVEACPICRDLVSGHGRIIEKSIPPELADLVEEFIHFAIEPSPRDQIWSKYTLEILRDRVAERKAAVRKKDSRRK